MKRSIIWFRSGTIEGKPCIIMATPLGAIISTKRAWFNLMRHYFHWDGNAGFKVCWEHCTNEERDVIQLMLSSETILVPLTPEWEQLHEVDFNWIAQLDMWPGNGYKLHHSMQHLQLPTINIVLINK